MDNTALKSFRFERENPPGTPTDWSGVDLTHRDPCLVLRLKRTKGPAFEMVEPRQEWSWKRMLNRLDDATLERVIGPGVTSIFCKPIGKPGASSYDHKREHHANHGGVPFEDVNGAPADVPVWEFVIHRGDGESVRLHPNQTAPTARVCMTHVHYPRQPRAVRQKGAARNAAFTVACLNAGTSVGRAVRRARLY